MSGPSLLTEYYRLRDYSSTMCNVQALDLHVTLRHVAHLPRHCTVEHSRFAGRFGPELKHATPKRW